METQKTKTSRHKRNERERKKEAFSLPPPPSPSHRRENELECYWSPIIRPHQLMPVAFVMRLINKVNLIWLWIKCIMAISPSSCDLFFILILEFCALFFERFIMAQETREKNKVWLLPRPEVKSIFCFTAWRKTHRTDRIHSISYNKLFLSFLLYWAVVREVSIKLYLSYEFFSYDRYNDMETKLKFDVSRTCHSVPGKLKWMCWLAYMKRFHG